MKVQTLNRALELNDKIRMVEDKIDSLSKGCKIQIDSLIRGKIEGLDAMVEGEMRIVALCLYREELVSLKKEFESL